MVTVSENAPGGGSYKQFMHYFQLANSGNDLKCYSQFQHYSIGTLVFGAIAHDIHKKTLIIEKIGN